MPRCPPSLVSVGSHFWKLLPEDCELMKASYLINSSVTLSIVGVDMIWMLLGVKICGIVVLMVACERC